jgi:hypothetical protein
VEILFYLTTVVSLFLPARHAVNSVLFRCEAKTFREYFCTHGDSKPSAKCSALELADRGSSCQMK